VWPTDAHSLITYQQQLASVAARLAILDPRSVIIAGCWVCFPRGLSGPGTDHDPAWCATVIMSGGRVIEQQMINGTTSAAYVPGLMALRVGLIMEQAVLALSRRPDVLLLDATARDHPRRAGLALHLGAQLDLPTIGVTHRPLIATGDWPADQRGATSPLRIGDAVVGCWLRTQPGVRPLAVHPGWRLDLATAVDVVTFLTKRRRTPEPLRRARQLARRTRTQQQMPMDGREAGEGHLTDER
jgi:deoxyribonuclease V